MSMKLRLSSSLNTCRTTSVPVSWVLYQQVGLSVTPGPGLTAVLSVWTHSDSRKTSSARQVKVSASIVPATADQRGEAARPELPVVPRIHSAAERAERRQPGCSYWWWWWRSGRRRSAGFSSAAAHVPVRRSRAAPSGAAAAARAHQTSTLLQGQPISGPRAQNQLMKSTRWNQLVCCPQAHLRVTLWTPHLDTHWGLKLEQSCVQCLYEETRDSNQQPSDYWTTPPDLLNFPLLEIFIITQKFVLTHFSQMRLHPSVWLLSFPQDHRLYYIILY